MGATKHDSCFIYIVSTCWVNGGVVELGPNYRETFLDFTTYMIMSFPVNGLGLPRCDLWVLFEKLTGPNSD